MTRAFFTSFDGTRIAYRDVGCGHPVLLLHGYMWTADMNYGPWSSLDAAFSGRMAEINRQAGFSSQIPVASPQTEAGIAARLMDIGARVVVPDMRGHGASDKPTNSAAYRDSAMARDAIALLDYIDVNSVDVLGYSMGSITALRLLALGDRRVRSVIIGGMDPSLSIEGVSWRPSDWEEYATDHGSLPSVHASARTWKEWTEYAADVLMGAQPAFGVADSYAKFADAIGFDRAVAAAALRSLGERIAPERLKGVDVPMLVLNADDDVMKLREREFCDFFPHVRFGTAHGDHTSALFDSDFQREIIEFLKRRWDTEI